MNLGREKPTAVRELPNSDDNAASGTSKHTIGEIIMGSRHIQVLGTGRGTIKIGPPVGIRVHGRHAPGSRFSTATGKSKGMIPNPIDKVTAKKSRSYKTKNYPSWCRRYDGIHKPKRGSA